MAGDPIGNTLANAFNSDYDDPNDDIIHLEFPYLFKRDWELKIGPPGQKNAQDVISIFVLNKSLKSFRMVFDFEKTSNSTPNKGKISVYNLGTLSRQNYKKGSFLTFTAGYKGLAQPIFIGQALRVTNERKGPDIITTFEVGADEKALMTATIQKSYPAGIPFFFVVKDLLAALGLSIGILNLGKSAALIYNKGLTISGSVKQQLDNMLEAQNLIWNTNNGIVSIYPVGTTITPIAEVVNRKTGLIGIPSSGNGGDNITTFTSLLNPKLKSGTFVRLDSKDVNGFFAIKNAHIEGDTHSNKWETTCECTPINAAALL